jgi:hypothetical protein
MKTYSMNEIARTRGETKIQLKIAAKLVKKRPYNLNLKYKEKVKHELDIMLSRSIIFVVEESKWINPMEIQKKKRG